MQDSFPVGALIDGRYRLVKMLRKGGMGEIYAGEHVHTHRRVAVKILREPWSRDHVTRERFKREARNLADLTGWSQAEIESRMVVGGQSIKGK